MPFDKLKTEHYVVIAVVIVVLVLLFMYGTKEGFIQPDYLGPVKLTYWSPWFYAENAYDTIVPKVYDDWDPRFQDIERLSRKDVKEGFGDIKSLNLTTIVVIALLAAIMYHLFTHDKE